MLLWCLILSSIISLISCCLDPYLHNFKTLFSHFILYIAMMYMCDCCIKILSMAIILGWLFYLSIVNGHSLQACLYEWSLSALFFITVLVRGMTCASPSFSASWQISLCSYSIYLNFSKLLSERTLNSSRLKESSYPI